jgi:hypothetical protein
MARTPERHDAFQRIRRRGSITPNDMLVGRQQEIHAERDRKFGSRQTATPVSPPAAE